MIIFSISLKAGIQYPQMKFLDVFIPLNDFSLRFYTPKQKLSTFFGSSVREIPPYVRVGKHWAVGYAYLYPFVFAPCFIVFLHIYFYNITSMNTNEIKTY